MLFRDAVDVWTRAAAWLCGFGKCGEALDAILSRGVGGRGSVGKGIWIVDVDGLSRYGGSGWTMVVISGRGNGSGAGEGLFLQARVLR